MRCAGRQVQSPGDPPGSWGSPGEHIIIYILEPAGTGTGWNRLVWPHERCAVATQDACCGKTRPLWWQETREAAFGRPCLWFPCLSPPSVRFLLPEPTPRFSRFGSYLVRFRQFRLDSAASCIWGGDASLGFRVMI